MPLEVDFVAAADGICGVVRFGLPLFPAEWRTPAGVVHTRNGNSYGPGVVSAAIRSARILALRRMMDSATGIRFPVPGSQTPGGGVS